VPFKTVEYLKETPTIEELKSLLQKLKLKPHDIIRTNESVYVDNYKGKTFTDEEWIQILHEHPILIERPIVVNGNKAVVARPPEKVQEIL
ncbi:MAG TPA: ArsC/Spx/MgsR family protein, partial [Chitinophagales bacterium]|nr:ArsC/Spx/MgsR family protein [Chitinophagales bacterium]